MLNAGNAIFSNLYLLFGIGIALTSFLTGITEPIEFLFVFVSRSVFHPCRFVRCRSGGHATAGLPARLWFLGWSNRLLDELLPVYQRLVAYSDRPCLRRHLLFRLLLRYC